MIHPKKQERQIERTLAAAPLAEESAPDLFQIKEPLEPAELALLRQFFEVLAEWDESQEGENHATLTLEDRKSMADALAGRKFPCQLCGAGLEIHISRKPKPYTTCLSCGVQNFYRGQKGIRRLREILDSDPLITANEPSVDAAVLLFNRMQQLRAQKKELTAKRGFVFSDSDSQNTTKIAQLQGELAKLARKSRRGKKK